MARSRVGGSTAKLSGVLGSLLFTIGKSTSGSYEQYIASYSGIRENPNTKYQALARMQIAVIERMVHILTPILRVSFEGCSVGVESVNEFSRLNVKDVQSYCQKYWKNAYGWSFPLKGNPLECWAPLIISSGTLKVPKIWSLAVGRAPYFLRSFTLQAPVGKYRVTDLRKALDLTRKGSFTFVLIWGTYQSFRTGSAYIKVSVADLVNDYDDYRAISPADLFKIESHVVEAVGSRVNEAVITMGYQFAANQFVFTPKVITRSEYGATDNDTFLAGLVYSDYRRNQWRKSTSRLEPPQVYQPDEEYGRAPYEAFQTWDENYVDEDYDEYFGKK